MRGGPAKFVLDFGRVDGVAEVMPGPVGDEGDEFARGARQAAVCDGEAAPVRSDAEAELLGASPDMAAPQEVRDAPVRPIDD